jgi:hypothetical protein
MMTSTGRRSLPARCALRLDVGEKRRTHVVAALQPFRPAGAAANQARAFGDADTDHFLHAVELCAVGHRPVRGLRRTRIADDERGCRLARNALDLREAVPRHDDAGGGAARLTDVAHARRHRGRYRAREIGIGQDDVGRLAAEFLGDALDGGAAACATSTPARVEPVIEIMSTSGCVASALPTSAPWPLTRLNTPAGTPASCTTSANSSALSGDSSLGFRTMVQPCSQRRAHLRR